MPTDTRHRNRTSKWQARYGTRHGYVRLADESAIPNGRRGRVTIYQRGDHGAPSVEQTFILSWCANGRKRKERIKGDKFDAVRRADEINEAMACGTAPHSSSRLDARSLVQRYVEHLGRRADAGDISPRTVQRYRSALGHLIAFLEADAHAATGRQWVPNRDFVLRFRTHLHGLMIAPNGHPHSTTRPLCSRGIDYIIACVRSMTRWAAQENLISSQASAVFSDVGRGHVRGPTLAALPISTEEIVSLIHVADLYQLVAFSFHIFHGARVAEPCWLMIEFFDPDGGWIDYRCIEELGHRTKGAVDKRLPTPEAMAHAISLLLGTRTGGPLLLQRRFVAVASKGEGAGTALSQIKRTIHGHRPMSWTDRSRASEAMLKSIGAVDGDYIRREFKKLRLSANVRADVTPKALRHYFATALETADVPYYTRKFLLGHRLGDGRTRGQDVTSVYTHLAPEFIKSAYARVIEGPLAGIHEAFQQRLDGVCSESMLSVAANRQPGDRRPT
jgi:integrase